MNKTPSQSAETLMAPLRNPEQASPLQLDLARITLSAFQKAGVLNPNWRDVGVQLRGQTSSSETKTPVPSSSKPSPSAE
jgi:hypothetical protein